MELRNGLLGITLDEKTGNLLRIVDHRSGLVHLDAATDGRADGRLFKIMIPRPKRFSCCIENHLQSPPQIDTRPDGVTLRWRNLLDSDRNTTGVDVEARLTKVDDEIQFAMTVTNRGERDLLDACFPILGGWMPRGGKGEDKLIFPGFSNADYLDFPIPSGGTYGRTQHRRTLRYPLEMYAPWMDLSGPGGGLSYIVKDSAPRNSHLAIENMASYDLKPVRVLLGWTVNCLIRPGQTWTSSTVCLSV
ncbi:MAG: hypothetical protein IT440_08335, partial [Phycisphaeraceae bacterium]|nr:hypothetical protein [Phycisphaeraceae bacterium]